MSVRANIFDSRPAKFQYAAPRSDLDRHPQPAKAGKAAVALIPYDHIKRPSGEEKHTHHGQGAKQRFSPVAEGPTRIFLGRKKTEDLNEQRPKKDCRDRHLGGEPSPVAHIT